MVYYKIVFDDRKPTKDCSYPIVIRITANRKSTTFTTGVRIKKEYWDEDSFKIKNEHPNRLELNKKILEFYLKVQKAVLELEGTDAFSFDLLKEKISDQYKPIKIIQSAIFKSFAERLITDMLSINKAGNAIIYQTATNKIMAYANNPKLKFTDITYKFLEGFKNNLIKSGLKANSISNYFRTIRAIYNKGIKEKLIDRSHYPFLDITVKTERTAKRAISLEELLKLTKLELKPKSQEWKARSYFLLSFALRGASFTDLAYIKPENIKKGYITYKRRKTGKELKIKLFPFTLDLFNHYKGSNSKYLLPILPSDIIEDSLAAKKVIYQWIKTSNKYLTRIGGNCEIEDDVTSYVTRHTFATLAKKKLGYSNEVIAECLGHEYGNRITNTYLDSYDQSVIDEVNEKVINLLNS